MTHTTVIVHVRIADSRRDQAKTAQPRPRNNNEENAVLKSNRNNEDPIRAGRRQFLGSTGAGMLRRCCPARRQRRLNSSPYPQTIAMGQQMIQQAVSNSVQPVAAISVAMLKGNSVVWQQAFGVSSVPSQTARRRSRHASISDRSANSSRRSRPTILQDRGLITLDTPIVRYLPTFTMLSPEYTQITTRHLLSHSSGLPGTNGRNLFTFAPVPGYAADTQAELANTHLKHLPGELAVYCNDGFTMVEQIVLAMTGQSFASFVETDILAPCKMTNSSYLTSVPASGSFSYPYAKGTSIRNSSMRTRPAG